VSTAEPVKIVLERHVRPGAQEPFTRWAESLVASATASGALQGASVLAVGGDEYLILLRFASQAHLDRWRGSASVARLLADGEELATSSEPPTVRTGLEAWFVVPNVSPHRASPPRWKMALVTWLALLPQVVVLGLLMPAEVPFLASVAVTTALPVAALTWVVMPWLTSRLHRWLYVSAPAVDAPQGGPHAVRA
jgi:antibiotic biosynthesis monooxygenase (ABM) superfamily enzyme